MWLNNSKLNGRTLNKGASMVLSDTCKKYLTSFAIAIVGCMLMAPYFIFGDIMFLDYVGELGIWTLFIGVGFMVFTTIGWIVSFIGRVFKIDADKDGVVERIDAYHERLAVIGLVIMLVGIFIMAIAQKIDPNHETILVDIGGFMWIASITVLPALAIEGTLKRLYGD
nr:MAG TPA: hypothetical protein [Caudoviricetes sp.]